MCEIKKVESVKDYFKKLEEEERKHHIRTKLSRFYYRIVRFLEYIPLNIKTFIQRGKRGYGDYDIWDFDAYLGKIIYEGLLKLKKDKHGYPATINPENGQWDYNEKRWDTILDKMIEGFAIVKQIGEGTLEITYMLSEEEKIELNKTWKEFDSRIILKEEEQKIEESFNLFKKYFFCLWD